MNVGVVVRTDDQTPRVKHVVSTVYRDIGIFTPRNSSVGSHTLGARLISWVSSFSERAYQIQPRSLQVSSSVVQLNVQAHVSIPEKDWAPGNGCRIDSYPPGCRLPGKLLGNPGIRLIGIERDTKRWILFESQLPNDFCRGEGFARACSPMYMIMRVFQRPFLAGHYHGLVEPKIHNSNVS